MLFDEKGERFCDVFVESGRVMNDFIRSFTRLRREEDLGSFDEALEAVSPVYLYRIFGSKQYGL